MSNKDNQATENKNIEQEGTQDSAAFPEGVPAHPNMNNALELIRGVRTSLEFVLGVLQSAPAGEARDAVEAELQVVVAKIKNADDAYAQAEYIQAIRFAEDAARALQEIFKANFTLSNN